MNAQTRELIAIGAAVTACCVPCLKVHLPKARAVGASDEEIAEAIRIGRMVRTGSAKAWDDEIADVLPTSAT